jgi:hypothetical protein
VIALVRVEGAGGEVVEGVVGGGHGLSVLGDRFSVVS